MAVLNMTHIPGHQTPKPCNRRSDFPLGSTWKKAGRRPAAVEMSGATRAITFKVEEILPKEAPEPGWPPAAPAPPSHATVPQAPAAAKVWPDLSGYPMVPAPGDWGSG